MLAGSGYAPWTTEIGGVKKGIVRLFSIHYRDTDSGPYNAFVIQLDAYKIDGSGPKTFPWVNAFSSMIPMAAPGNVFFYSRMVDNSYSAWVFEHIDVDESDAAKISSAVSLAQAFGLSGPADLPPPAAEYPFAGATWDVLHPGQTKTVTAAATFAPTMTAWNPARHHLVVGGKKPLSQQIIGMEFSPQIVTHDAHAKFVMDSP
jgi:hypothetical protein